MEKKARIYGRRVHKKYEWSNLLFFLCVAAALVLFVMLVFRVYSTPDTVPSKAKSAYSVILKELVPPSSNNCIFYLETEVSGEGKRYNSVTEVPATDDGLTKELFSIPGVMGVQINQRSIVLYKTPSAHWEEIQPGAREIITKFVKKPQ